MYTEGVDEFNEAENRPPRTYVSTGGQDSMKLQRENERLKKSLEKEQFFNRLLDQELKELKNSGEGVNNNAEFYQRQNGVSRSAFNTLLVISIALAGFLAYTIFNNKQHDLFPQSAKAEMPEVKSGNPSAVVRDSVPNIISSKTTNTPPPVTSQQSTVVPGRAPFPEKAAASVKESPAKPKTEHIEKPVADNTPEAVPAAAEAAKEPDPVVTQPAPAPAERTVIGKYMISSKANFYSAPDGNTLRSYFISPGDGKVVNALEDKNGFIYVEFKNDVGYVTKGWLSKADLTKQ
ncbi:MAG: hypothetical protein H0X41_04145 [Chitinophagaceae bacterium]|nr:hypothetical protein [Chitinophagaceae bacterium]